MKILIAIPAYNEAKILRQNIEQIVTFIRTNFSQDQLKIVIADNNSKDNTRQIADQLMAEYPEVGYLFVGEQGKGYAVIAVWQKWQAEYDIFSFMDADLATDLAALPDLIEGIKQGNDLVIGSRYLKGSRINRTIARRIFSFGYHLFLEILLGTRIKDMPCGFKALNKKVLQEIVPQITNRTWFFDSELVYLAEKNGFKIKEIPVNWQEPRQAEDKSRVNLTKVTYLYLKESLRLRWQRKK